MSERYTFQDVQIVIKSNIYDYLRTFGDRLQFLAHLIDADSQHFYQEFLSVGNQPLGDTIDIKYDMWKIITNILEDKLLKIECWVPEDEEKIHKTLKVIDKVLEINLQYKFFNGKLKNVLKIYDLIDEELITIKDPNSWSGQIFQQATQFLNKNFDLCFKEDVDKQEWTYLYYQGLSQISKSEFQLRTLKIIINNKVQVETAKEKIGKLYERHIQTQSLTILRHLALINDQRSREIIRQVLNLKLEVSNISTQQAAIQSSVEKKTISLFGDCRINKSILTSQFLMECLAKQKCKYQYFSQSFFFWLEDAVYLKFDVLNSKDQIYLQLHPCQIRGNETKIKQFIASFLSLQQNIKKLLFSIEKVPIFIYTFSEARKLSQEEAEDSLIVVCMKLYYHFFQLIYQQKLIEEIDKIIDFDILKHNLVQIISLKLKGKVSQKCMDAICLLFQYFNELFTIASSNYLQKVYSKDAQESEDIVKLLWKLILKYLNQNKDQKKLTPKITYWLYWFFPILQSHEVLKELNDDQLAHISRLIYASTDDKNRYDVIISPHIKYDQYYLCQRFTTLLDSVPRILKYFQEEWRKDLLFFQSQETEPTSVNDDTLKSRLTILLITLIHDNFEIDEQTCMRVKNVIKKYTSTYDLTNISQQSRKKLLTKIKFAEDEIIDSCNNLVRYLEDEQILSRNYQEFTSSWKAKTKELNNFIYEFDNLINILEMRKTFKQVNFSANIAEVYLSLQKAWHNYYRHQVQLQTTFDQPLCQKLVEQPVYQKFIKQTLVSQFNKKIPKIMKQYTIMTKSIANINTFVLSFTPYLSYIVKNIQKIELIDKLLNFFIQDLRAICDHESIQFYPQFYNFNKDLIIEVIIKLINHYNFRHQESEQPSPSLDQNFIKNVLKFKKQGKDVQTQYQKGILKKLESTLKQFIGHVFGNNHWERIFVINNVHYKKLNHIQSVLFSVLNDFVIRQIKEFKVENIYSYYFIWKVIDDSYQRKSNNQQPDQTAILDLPLSDDPLIILSDSTFADTLSSSASQLLKELFRVRYQIDNVNAYNKLEQFLNNYVKDDAKKANGKQNLKLLIEDLYQVITSPEINSERYCKINENIYYKLEKIGSESVSDILTSQFIMKYLEKVQKDLSEKLIIEQQAKYIVKFVQKLIPSSLPKQKDQKFLKYYHFMVQLLIKLVNIKPKDYQGEILTSAIIKMIRIKNTEFNASLTELIQIVQHKNDEYEDLFCQLAKDQLKLVTIELEVKCLFLQLYQINKQDSISLQMDHFIQTFKPKFSSNVDQFKKILSVVSKFTTVRKRKQNNKLISYICFDTSKEHFQYSHQIGKQFMNFKLSPLLHNILSHLLDNINEDPKTFNEKLESLYTIISNYSILIPHIMLHKIKQDDKEIFFFEYLLQRISSNNQQTKINKLISYCCLDINLIAKIGKSFVFFSEILCYLIICRLIKSSLSCRELLFIQYMVKIKRFSNICRIKIGDSSLVDKLQLTLRQARSDFTFGGGENAIIYIALSVIYRQAQCRHLERYYYRKSGGGQGNWQDYSEIVNSSIVPFKNILVKKQYKDLLVQSLEVHQDEEKVNFKLYQQFLQSYANFVHQQNQLKLEEQKQQQRLGQNLKNIQFKPQYLTNIGISLESDCFRNSEHYQENRLDNQHNNLHSRCVLMFLDLEETTEVKRQRNRNQSIQYNLFQQRQDDQESERSQSNNEELENQLNTEQPSRFAPEDFSRQKKIEQADENEDEINKARSQFEKDKEENIQTQILVSHPTNVKQKSKVTEDQMVIFNNINERLTHLNKDKIILEQIEGKTQDQIRQFLQSKELEVDFDQKQATMSVDEFQSYCLSNCVKLQRLNSVRKNIVSNIQEAMLSRFVQRSISQDSVDYMIDTIDQNYQLLSRKKTGPIPQNVIKEQPKQKNQKKPSFFNIVMLSKQIFPQIDDSTALQVILSLYYIWPNLPINYLVPFFQNKSIQDKCINTLLYILRNPFENNHFPDKLTDFNCRQRKWSVREEGKQSKQVLNKRIIKLIHAVRNHTFYQEENFLNRQISYQGFQDISITPLDKLQNFCSKQIHNPIYQILDHILDYDQNQYQKNEEQDYETFACFRGLKKLPDYLIDKLIVILKRIQQIYINKAQNESDTDHNDVRYRLNQLKYYNFDANFDLLFQNQVIKQRIKKEFPISQTTGDCFLVTLLLDRNIYTKQQLLSYHKMIILRQRVKSTDLVFCNKAFKLYDQNLVTESKWLIQTKKILSSILQNLPKSQKLKQQPIYILQSIKKDLSFEFKYEWSNQKIQQYKDNFNYNGDEEIMAKKKKGIFQSAFQDLRNKPDGFWYMKHEVKFMNADGNIESGYGKGVTKDWYTYVSKGMANLNYGLIMKTSKNYYFFNRQSWINPRHLQLLEFIGKLFALSILNKELYVGPSFSILLYKMILGQKIEISDLIKQFDEGEVICNIQKMRQYTDDSLFCENFTYEDKRLISSKNLQILKRKRSVDTQSINQQESVYLIQQAVQVDDQEEELQALPKSHEQEHAEQKPPRMLKVIKIGQSIQLIPGGSNKDVNMDNLEDFIRLTKQKIYDIIVSGVKKQFEAFMEGFSRIIKPQFISNFTAEELREVAEGSDKISIEDLKKNVTLSRGLSHQDENVKWFWSILQALPPKDKSYFIQHWTGLPKISAEGFKNTKLTLVRGDDEKRLFAQTCFNKLRLPKFQKKQLLEEAVIMAINSVKLGLSIIED